MLINLANYLDPMSLKYIIVVQGFLTLSQFSPKYRKCVPSHNRNYVRKLSAIFVEDSRCL